MTMDRLGLNVIAKSISVEIYSWSQQVSDLEFFWVTHKIWFDHKTIKDKIERLVY